MKAILVRVGIDQAYGAWNAPVDADGKFVYVPIPEAKGVRFHAGLERRYGEMLPALHRFCNRHAIDLHDDLAFPQDLLGRSVHLDPDFECLTYGDSGTHRGVEIAKMVTGDLLVFYCGFRPIHDCEHNLLYALMGLYVVDEVVKVAGVPEARWYENAHLRRTKPNATDIVVRAIPEQSGRFECCIPVGEWRDGAYRVRKDVLAAWGGLSVTDGYIQRSAVLPSFNNPKRFLTWLGKHPVKFLSRNN